ncbi:MAG: AAA family ATPase, partial [Planctomycetota bacterium]
AFDESGEIMPWARDVVEQLDSYTEYSPSGNGLHIWVKGTLPKAGSKKKIKNAAGEKIGGMEIYSRDRFFTVTGKHYEGTPETIENRNLDGFWRAHFDNPESKRITAKYESDVPVEDWILSALNHIDSHDYYDWIKVGTALKTEFGESGFGYFDAWSQSASNYDGERATHRQWEALKIGEVNIGSIVWLAEQNGFRPPAKKRAPTLETDWAAWADDQLRIKNQSSKDSDAAEVHDGLSIRFVNFAESYEDQSPLPPDLIGEGFLTTGDFALVFGPPKSMKSMMVLDMCRNWAVGKHWFDLTVERPLKIAYLQFELKESMMRKRIQLASLESEDLDLLRENFFFTDRMSATLTSDFAIRFAESVFKTMGEIDLLVIDPLANIYTGDDENNNAQMSTFIRSLKALRNQISPSVAIMLVHHSSKLDKQSRHAEPFNAIRGASSLRGAYDSGIYLDITEGFKRRAWFELRNGPSRNPLDIEFDRGRFVNMAGVRSDGFRDLKKVEEKVERVKKPKFEAEILKIKSMLRSDAECEFDPKLHTMKDFIDAYSKIFGSKSRLKKILIEASDFKHIGFAKNIFWTEVKELHHKSHGFMTVGDLFFHGVEVEPEFFVIEGELIKNEQSE